MDFTWSKDGQPVKWKCKSSSWVMQFHIESHWAIRFRFNELLYTSGNWLWSRQEADHSDQFEWNWTKSHQVTHTKNLSTFFFSLYFLTSSVQHGGHTYIHTYTHSQSVWCMHRLVRTYTNKTGRFTRKIRPFFTLTEWLDASYFPVHLSFHTIGSTSRSIFHHSWSQFPSDW